MASSDDIIIRPQSTENLDKTLDFLDRMNAADVAERLFAFLNPENLSFYNLAQLVILIAIHLMALAARYHFTSLKRGYRLIFLAMTGIVYIAVQNGLIPINFILGRIIFFALGAKIMSDYLTRKNRYGFIRILTSITIWLVTILIICRAFVPFIDYAASQKIHIFALHISGDNALYGYFIFVCVTYLAGLIVGEWRIRKALTKAKDKSDKKKESNKSAQTE